MHIGDDTVGRVRDDEFCDLGLHEGHAYEEFLGGFDVVDGDVVFEAGGEADLLRREFDEVGGERMVEEVGVGGGGDYGHVFAGDGKETCHF